MKLKIINLDDEQFYQTYCDGTGDELDGDSREIMYAVTDEIRRMDDTTVDAFRFVHTIYTNTGIDLCIEVESPRILTLSFFGEHHHCAAGLRLMIEDDIITLSQYDPW